MSKRSNSKLPGRIKDRAAAYEAVRELIHGEGTSASHQRSIDLARIALGYEARGYRASTAALPTLLEPRDPNYCHLCTPKGLGYCRCEIACND